MFFVLKALSQLRQGVEGGKFKQGHALLAQVCFSITIEYLFCPRILAKGKPDHWGALDVGDVDDGGTDVVGFVLEAFLNLFVFIFQV